MTQRRKWCAAVLAAVLCAGLVACSSDDESAKERTGTTTTAAEGSTSTSASPTSAVDAGPSTSGPPATAGEGVAVGANVLDPVDVGTFADLGGSVMTTVASWKEVTATAEVPGDIAGPAIAVTVELRNDSAEPVDASSLVVGATIGGATAPPNSGPPSAPMTAPVAPGAEASGVYVFRLPGKDAEDVVVDIQTGFSPNAVRVRL